MDYAARVALPDGSEDIYVVSFIRKHDLSASRMVDSVKGVKRIAAKLARCVRNLHRCFFDHNLGPKHLHAACGVFLRRQRTETRWLIS